MNSASVYGGAVFTRIALASSTIGLGFLSQSSATQTSRLSSTSTPLMNVSPTVKKLSESESSQSKKIDPLSDSAIIQIEYTQKQLECAEKLGVAASECTRNGHLINTENNPIEKRTTENINLQQACANRLEVNLESCNTHGVFTNRNEQVSNAILNQLNVDSWDNVTANDLAEITRLDLRNLGITTLSESDLDGLTGVTTLLLNNNQLTSISISSTLSSLEVLYLNDNQLTSISIPDTLINLNWLYLNNNRLTSVTIPDTLVNLNWVNLSENQLTSISIPDTLINLAWLFLNDNQLTSITLPDTLRSLTWLYLNENQLTSFTIPDTFTNLERLNISNNQLSSITIHDTLSKLVRLNLNNNQLSSFTVPATLTELHWMNLGSNQLSSITIPDTLTKLTWLYLNNNRLSSFAIPSTLTELGWLFLNDNQLTSFTIPNTLTNLTWLYLNNNQLTTMTIPETLTNLFRLYLNNNELTSITLPSTLNQLQLLLLQDNQFTNFTLSHPLPALRHLNLGNNPLITLSAPWNEMPKLSGLTISGSENLLITADILNFPFANNAHLWLDNDSQLSINENTYQWIDVKDIFGNSVTSSTADIDEIWPEFQFRFPDLSELSSVQISFLADLETLPSHSFPRIPITIAQLACAEKLGVAPENCNRQGVYLSRNIHVKNSILENVSATTWDDVTKDMLKGIKDLHLEKKGITSLNTNDLDGLNLESLYLHLNELSELPSGLLDNMPDLKIFYAHNNNLSEIPEGFFDNNPDLQTIYLQKNQLHSLPKNTFSDIHKLRSLRLHINHLSTLPPDFLSQSTRLRELTLYSNPLLISENIFTRLLVQEPNAVRKFRIVYDRLSTYSNILVELGNGTTIPLSTVVPFFEHETNINNLIFYPSTISEPDSTTLLTDSQRTFLCRYLDNPSPSLYC